MLQMSTTDIPVGSLNGHCRKWVSPEGNLLPVPGIYIRMRKITLQKYWFIAFVGRSLFVETIKELSGPGSLTRWIPWQDCCHSLRVLVPNMGKWPWLHSKHAIKPCIWLSDVLLFFLICELLNKGQSEIAKVSKLEGTDSVIQWDRGMWGEERGWHLMCYLGILFCVKIIRGDPGMAQQMRHRNAADFGSSLWSAMKLNRIVLINNRPKIHFEFHWWKPLLYRRSDVVTEAMGGELRV